MSTGILKAIICVQRGFENFPANRKHLLASRTQVKIGITRFYHFFRCVRPAGFSSRSRLVATETREIWQALAINLARDECPEPSPETPYIIFAIGWNEFPDVGA